MTRIYADQPINVGDTITLTGRNAHHLSHVLRLTRGDAVTLFNGQGGEFSTRIEGINRHAVNVTITAYDDVSRESPVRLTLVQAISRGEKMDYTVQKAVELGIQQIVPVLSDRSVVRLTSERAAKRIAHWQGVVIAASEQCGRTAIAAVADVQTLDAWLRNADCSSCLWLSPNASANLADCAITSASTTIVVGPEGGFSAAEKILLEDSNCLPVSMGPRTLRTETAAVAALAILQSRCGDLKS